MGQDYSKPSSITQVPGKNNFVRVSYACKYYTNDNKLFYLHWTACKYFLEHIDIISNTLKT